MKPKVVVLIVLAVLAVIIAIQNAQVATLRLLFWSIGMSQIIWTLLCLVIGFVAGYLVAKVTAIPTKA